MDELDRFREFRAGVAAPSTEAERRASALLTQVTERRYGRRTRVLLVARRRRGRMVLALAVVAGAAVAALFVGSPWKGSPGFLEKTQAAVVPPEGSILHLRLVRSVTSEGYEGKGCTVTTGADELWIDQTPPHRWRAFVSDHLWTEVPGADSPGFVCASRGVTELGSSDSAPETLMFVAPDSLLFSPQHYLTPPGDPEYVAKLREAIASGRAHDEGTAQLDGRTVERIRFEPTCPVPPCTGTSYAYVDPETFFPVREEWPTGYATVTPDGRVHRFDVVVRYLTFEYLPRTAANLALTDIRAQHPNATGP